MSEGRQGQVQRCLLDPGTNHFGRNLKSLKGWRRTRSRGYRARQTDDCSAENRRCPSAYDVQHNRNKTQQCRNPAGTSSCSSPKIGNRPADTRRHESWPTNDFTSEPWAARFRCLFCPRNVDCFRLLDFIPSVPLPTSTWIRYAFS
jgi:hypothetical protein